MDRDCNKCVWHTDGNCKKWDCEYKTVEDIKAEGYKQGYADALAKKQRPKAKECSCYASYPNESHKKKNGKWKCVDDYECVRNCTHKQKTKCVLKENNNESKQQ